MTLRHLLVIRTDRMGDMILTSPLFTAIKQAYPDCRLTVLASAAGAPIARAHSAVDAVEIDPIPAKGSSWRGTLSLARRLRALQCDAAVVVFSKHRLAVAAWWARIPVRIGPGQRGYSFLYTHPVRQDHRTPPIRHETSYCLDLLRPLGIDPDPAARPTWQVSGSDMATIEKLLASQGITPAQAVATIHPGHGGSSFNWTAQQYAELADCLTRECGLAIAITGSADEVQLAADVCAAMSKPAISLAGQLSVAQLAALLARSALYVGSSTGPTHLAAAVGTPVVALYSPLAESRPERWRPQVDACEVLIPPVGQVCARCLGARCPYFPCMEWISVRAAADAAQRLLRRRPVTAS